MNVDPALAVAVILGAIGLRYLVPLGIKAIADAVSKGLQGWLQLELDKQLSDHRHELDKQLENYKLGPAMVLALFTQRSGLLSEVQLKAAQETWTALDTAHSHLARLIAPLKYGPDAAAIRAQNESLTNQLLAKNAELFTIARTHRPFLPKTLLDHVHAYTNKLEKMSQFLEERRAFIDTLRDTPLPERPKAATTARDYGVELAERVIELATLAETVEQEIRSLTSPKAKPLES